jgi:hypothetical protein
MLALGISSPSAQERRLYVADVVGVWEVTLSGASPTRLMPLTRVPEGGAVRYAGDSAEAPSALLVVRDARTLEKARVRCSTSKACAQPLPVVQLPFVRATVAPNAATGALYATTGERDAFREKLRIVGARGDDRQLAATIVVLSDGGLDVGSIARELGRPGAGLVARFCALTGTMPEECLESRRPLATDCPLDTPRCHGVSAAGAYRVDVYAKERTLLSSVAVASGFGIVVAPSQLASATAERDALVAPLLRGRAEFGDDEWRALLAAVAITVASGERR